MNTLRTSAARTLAAAEVALALALAALFMAMRFDGCAGCREPLLPASPQYRVLRNLAIAFVGGLYHNCALSANSRR